MKNNDFFVSQNEIAEHFGVNRSTINTWVKRGLPHLDGDRGKPGGYHIGHVLWWVMGRRRLDAMNYTDSTSALEKIMLARVSNVEDFGSVQKDEDKFDKDLEVYGYTPEQIKGARYSMAGFLRGWDLAVKIRRESMSERREIAERRTD